MALFGRNMACFHTNCNNDDRDNRVTANAIAKTARIGDRMAELKPEDKAAAVKKLQAENSGLVAMVDDGITDTPHWHKPISESHSVQAPILPGRQHT